MCFSYIILFQLLESNIVSFVKNELKKMQKVLSLKDKEILESLYKNEVLEGDDEKQRNSREAFLKITINFLKNMEQEELADHLQSSKIWEKNSQCQQMFSICCIGNYIKHKISKIFCKPFMYFAGV